MKLPSRVHHRYRVDDWSVRYWHGMYSVSSSNSLLQEALPLALRGHNYKLVKRQSLRVELHFFSFHVTSLWNCLPEEWCLPHQWMHSKQGRKSWDYGCHHQVVCHLSNRSGTQVLENSHHWRYNERNRLLTTFMSGYNFGPYIVIVALLSKTHFA